MKRNSKSNGERHVYLSYFATAEEAALWNCVARTLYPYVGARAWGAGGVAAARASPMAMQAI
jgi:hypothetical protein